MSLLPTIRVHTCTDKATVNYVRFMCETMQKLASHPNELHFTVHCIGPTATEKLAGWIRNAETLLVPGPPDSMHGSHGHAVCVEHALDRVDDGDIHLIVDSDTVVLAKGWDDYVRNSLLGQHKVGCMGTTYEAIGGFTSGGGNVQTYKDKPNVVWFAMSPEHSWRRLRAMPRKDKHVRITTPELAAIYGVPVGHAILCDVAWQIPQYLHDNSITCTAWEQIKPSDGRCIVLKGLSSYHEEYHVDGIPFVVHHRGSLRHAYRADRISKQFYSAVDAYLVEEVGRTEPRWTWNVEGYTPPGRPITASSPPRTEPEWVPTYKGEEWLKVSFNGNVIRKRGPLNRGAVLEFGFGVPRPECIGNLRVEGGLQCIARVNLPKPGAEPYVITFRNATTAPISVHIDGGSSYVSVPEKSVYWILVDMDGTFRVE